jgi:hypothetical protein
MKPPGDIAPGALSCRPRLTTSCRVAPHRALPRHVYATSDKTIDSSSASVPARLSRTLGVPNGRLAIVNASAESKLRAVLASVADKMLADFKASSVAKHSGSKGTVREAQLLNNYLRKYLPRNVIAEHSGEVVAVSGEVSGQCDIVILDPSTPPFWDEEDYRIVPVECLYGVIEVKSTLDKTELQKAWKQIARVKALTKEAYYPNPQPRWRKMYGIDWPYVPTRRNRVCVRWREP